MKFLGKTPVRLAIRAYRRWLSGRGPLRRVSCTFASTESCSAYGLRAVDELATSLPHALQLVRSRVRACRHSSVYRFERGLGWERDHDRVPADLVRALVARGERFDTSAQVLAARMMIARWRGERDVYAHATATLPIPVRAGDAAIVHYRRAVRRASVLVVVAALLMVVSLAAVVPVALGVVAIVNAHGSAKRLERQRVAAGFLRPAVEPVRRSAAVEAA